MAGRGNEELKAKLKRLQENAKQEALKVTPPSSITKTPVKTPVKTVEGVNQQAVESMDEEMGDDDLEALNREFEARKQALLEKSRAKQEEEQAKQEESTPDAQDTDAQLQEAMNEYEDDGKFRVEIVFQLVQLNNSLRELNQLLSKFTNG